MSRRTVPTRYRVLTGVDGSLCLYCGAPAEHNDHALPVAVARRCIAAGRTITEDERKLLVIVPACASCNLTLGGRYHPTMYDRLAHVRRQILRHDKHARAEEWSNDDLMDLGDGLRGQVARLQAASDETRRRLTYSSPILDPDGPCAGLAGAPRPLIEPGTLLMETIDTAKALADVLDDLKVPLDATVNAAATKLQAKGYAARRSLIATALQRRRPPSPRRRAADDAEPSWVTSLRDEIRDAD